MSRPGSRNSLTDVPGLSVGQSHDEAVRTGVTCIVGDAPMVAGHCVAGGGPGTRETDLLKQGTILDTVDAVVLSGGSAFGLASADGVAERMKRDGRGFGLIERDGVPKVPIIPGAILYDLANGGDKSWDASPYPELGRQAYDSRGTDIAIGRAGAGYGARAGAFPGGVGTASVVTDDNITVAAIVAVNCFGSVTIPGTDVYWAWPFEYKDEFGAVRPPKTLPFDPDDWGKAKANPRPGQNTTIACVATDVALTASQAHRVAQMASAGFARAIRPVFAPFDGDCVFAVSTAQQDMPEAAHFTVTRIGELAASTLARAIARGVHEARKQEIHTGT